MRIVILDPDGIQLGAADLCGLPCQVAPSGFLSTAPVVVTISKRGKPHSFVLRDADGTRRINHGNLLTDTNYATAGSTIRFNAGDLFFGFDPVDSAPDRPGRPIYSC